MKIPKSFVSESSERKAEEKPNNILDVTIAFSNKKYDKVEELNKSLEYTARTIYQHLRDENLSAEAEDSINNLYILGVAYGLKLREVLEEQGYRAEEEKAKFEESVERSVRLLKNIIQEYREKKKV